MHVLLVTLGLLQLIVAVAIAGYPTIQSSATRRKDESAMYGIFKFFVLALSLALRINNEVNTLLMK